MVMDEESVGTQYIICECGDNFPDEKLLNIHLANGHGDVEIFQCESCPEIFTDNNLLLNHHCQHEKQTEKLLPEKTISQTHDKKMETPQKTSLSYLKLKKVENHKPIKNDRKKKNPPVIKLQNLKKIDSITLLRKLKDVGSFVKLEPAMEPVLDIEEAVEEPIKSEINEMQQEMQMNESETANEMKSEMGEINEEIFYQCDVCNTIFNTEVEFNIHYQSTHAMKVEPTAEEILEDHLVTDHIDDVGVKAEVEAVETVYYYECEMCHKIFASEEYFNIHYNKVHSGLVTITEGPEQGVVVQEQQQEAAEERSSEDYLGDLLQGSPVPKAPEQVIYYKCDLCKILYPSEKAYNTHYSKKHGGATRRAAPCGFQFIEQDLTEEYPPVRPPQPGHVYCCEFCPKTFSVKRSLYLHRKRVHPDRCITEPAAGVAGKPCSRSKVCDVCGRAYNSNAALRYHQRRHTGEKPYPCTLCPKRFTMPMFLQIHLRTHTGERPYECPHCPKAFTNKAALIRHDRVHTGVKPYPCPECGKFFTQSNSMKLHVSTVHLKMPAPYKSKNRRNKSEARALQLALKGLPAQDEDGEILS